MNYYIIKSKRPKCRICKRFLKEWNPFVEPDVHVHPECLGKEIADNMMKHVNKVLNLEL